MKYYRISENLSTKDTLYSGRHVRRHAGRIGRRDEEAEEHTGVTFPNDRTFLLLDIPHGWENSHRIDESWFYLNKDLEEVTEEDYVIQRITDGLVR